MEQKMVMLPETEEQLALQVTETEILNIEQIGFVEYCGTLTVTDKATNDEVARVEARLKNLSKNMGALRLKENKPWRDKITANDNRWNEMIMIVDRARVKLTNQLTSFFREQKALEAKQQAQLNRQAERTFNNQQAKGIVPPVPEPVAGVAEAPQAQVKTEDTTTSIKTIMRWRPARPGISDNKKTSQIPDSYWMLDTKKLDQLVKGLKTQDQADDIFHGDIIIYPEYGTSSRVK